MRFSMLLAAFPLLCLPVGAVAGDGPSGRGHALGSDLARLAPGAAAPLPHPGQPLATGAAGTDCLPGPDCPSAEVALDQ